MTNPLKMGLHLTVRLKNGTMFRVGNVCTHIFTDPLGSYQNLGVHCQSINMFIYLNISHNTTFENVISIWIYDNIFPSVSKSWPDLELKMRVHMFSTAIWVVLGGLFFFVGVAHWYWLVHCHICSRNNQEKYSHKIWYPTDNPTYWLSLTCSL